MQAIDWLLTISPLLIVAVTGFLARRYVRGVADFVSANRCAGRYLLSIAGGELQAGAVVFVAQFEIFSHSGFSFIWWSWLAIPVYLLLRVSGFISYRFRETRALTLGQFFEIRYNKSFRLFAGLLCFLAGIFNFGVIPAIGARCLVYFLSLPETVNLFGQATPTYLPLMACFLSITLFVAWSGGIITVIVVNCVEGIVSQLFYLVIIFALLRSFHWSQISAALSAQPPGHSMLNPFDSFATDDFNVWLVIMMILLAVYRTNVWQNSSAYNSASLTPHEGRMGAVLGNWREMGKAAVITLLGACVYTYTHHPDFAAGAAHVREIVGHITDPQAREQMESPIALTVLLPAGVKGALCAVLLMGVFGGDATHLHSWGSIFVQDFLVPLRRTPFSPRQHLLALRLSILSVAVFAFIFGAMFRQTQYINMWWNVTEAIFVGGGGAALIGGLYWKKGTTAGAWAAILTGLSLSLGGIAAETLDPHFPLNGVQVAFLTMLCALTVYGTVSLLTCREDFNMDRMLHRGAYASLKPLLGEAAPVPRGRVSWGRLIGMDADFTLGDKWVVGLLFALSVGYIVVLIVGAVCNFVAPWSLATWSVFWEVAGIGLPIFFAVVTGLWFTWGGVRDIVRLFAHLARQRVNERDDGTVVNNRNADEVRDDV